MRPAVPEYWRLTPADLSPFLRKPVSSSTSTAVGIAQVLDHVGAQIIAHGVGIPVHAGEEVLHAIGAGIAGGFRQMPAVLARERREQPLQIGPGASARFDAAEPGSNPGDEIIQLIGPAVGLACVRHGSTPPCLR